MWSINHTKPWRVHRTQGTLHHYSYHNWGIHMASTMGWLIVVGYNVLDNYPCFVRNTVTQNWLMPKLDIPLLSEPVVSCILQHRHSRPHWEPPLHLLSWWVPPHSGSQCRGPQCSGGRGLSQPPDITQYTEGQDSYEQVCAWQSPVSLLTTFTYILLKVWVKVVKRTTRGSRSVYGLGTCFTRTHYQLERHNTLCSL